MTLQNALEFLTGLQAQMPSRPGQIRLDTSGTTAELLIDNPTARNAITVRMMIDLAEAVVALGEWSGSVVVVRSAGEGVFCAGGHLGELHVQVDDTAHAVRAAEAMMGVLDALCAHVLLRAHEDARELHQGTCCAAGCSEDGLSDAFLDPPWTAILDWVPPRP